MAINLLEKISRTKQSHPIRDIAELKYGFGLPERDRKIGSVPVYGSSGVVGYHSSSRVNKPSIIVGRKGNAGTVFYSGVPSYPIDTAYFIDIPSEGFDLKYIYYLLKRINLPRYSGDSAVPGLSRDSVYGLEVETPDFPTQKKIAEILSAYDEKIENNNKVIKNLELMAQTIFNEWFVKFRFSGYEKAKFVESEMGMIPEGWGIQNLYEVADVLFGYAFKSNLFNEDGDGIKIVRIRDVLSGTTETFSPEKVEQKYKIVSGDLLIGMDGIFHASMWFLSDCYLNQRVVRIRSELPTYFILQSIRTQLDFLQKTIIGATVGHLSNGDVRGFKILLPTDKSLLEPFRNITKKILELKKENAILKKSRDKLLTKLI